MYCVSLQRMCEQYRVPFEKEFKGHDGVAVYEVSLVDQLLFRMIKPVMERNLRRIVPQSRQVRGEGGRGDERERGRKRRRGRERRQKN